MGLYDYNNAVNDLSRKFGQDQVVQERGRFLGQQRFARQRQDMDREFNRGFPGVTGRLARRFGSRIGSGRIGADLGEYVNGYGRSMGRLDQDQAQFETDWMQAQAARESQRAAAMLRLKEQLDQGRAMSDPFAIYSSVWGQ